MEKTSRELALSVVIVDQPDGIGKTVILEIISALKSIR
jgi:hypothetical protein